MNTSVKLSELTEASLALANVSVFFIVFCGNHICTYEGCSIFIRMYMVTCIHTYVQTYT